MSQNNNGYQDLIINNGVITTMSNLVSSDNQALQGIQMNQFAICANPGSAPMLVPYLTPMLLSPHNTKISMNGNNQDNRSQNGKASLPVSLYYQTNSGQIQLGNNITIPSNMINSGNLPLGLSYINLSSLTSQAGGGTAIPIQLALNTGSNQQFTLPLASITQLSNDLQISNAYTLTPQIKFEPEIQITQDQINQLSGHNFQKQTVKCESEVPVAETQPTNKRGRKKALVKKTNKFSRPPKRVLETAPGEKMNPINVDTETMFDHKGRPFMYNCNQCTKRFTQNSRLTAHLRCHSGIRPYTCTQCGFSFTQKSYLIRHAAVHKEDRPFTCVKCTKTYKHYGSLANHRKLHCREAGNGGGSGHGDSQASDELDKTIQQTIEAVQMGHQSGNNNNYIVSYASSAATELQGGSVLYFNNQSASSGGGNNRGDLQIQGNGPVVFPSQELPSMSAVSLLPTNRTAINELKAITTGAGQVDVDDVPVSVPVSVSVTALSYQTQQQQHIKQEPGYYESAGHHN